MKEFTTADLFSRIDVPDDVRSALMSIVSTRGKWAGYLLANAPSPRKDIVRYMTWQLVMMELAPSRTSFDASFNLRVFGTEADVELVLRIEDYINRVGLGQFIKATEPAFRWNLWAMTHAREVGQKILIKHFANKEEFA